jgi:uncharacterized protein (TIGR00297 family)
VTGYSEFNRQLVHVATVLAAPLLRILTWQQAAALALAATIVNLTLLGRLLPSIVRPHELRTDRPGIVLFPLAILVLILLLPHRLDIVAIVWGVLAVGDGCATLAGTMAAGASLPWNRRKTWTGLAAFVAGGGAAAVALSVWMAPAVSPAPSLIFTIGAPLAATLVAAVVESLPIRLDDNVSVPAAAAATLWFAGHLDWAAGREHFLVDVATGALAGVPLAILTLRSSRMTAGAAIAGLLCAGVIYAGAYLAGLAVLAAALGLTLLSGRAGRWRGGSPAIEHERRSAGNIIANCLAGTLGALAERLSDEWTTTVTAVWLVAGIAAGASDTVASEIGKVFGGVPRAFPTWRRTAPGTPGAVSIAGTLAGATAAALIAVPAAALWLIPWTAVPVIVVACTIGAFVESALATAFEARGILDNNTLNFLNTAVAAAVAVAWASAAG